MKHKFGINRTVLLWDLDLVDGTYDEADIWEKNWKNFRMRYMSQIDRHDRIWTKLT